MKTSIQIGRILGIPIRLHITFLLILPVFAGAFAQIDPPLGLSDITPPAVRYLLSTVATILLFASVLAHELMHSYVAMKGGTRINNITLLLFGGIASMEEIPKDPKSEFKMAIVGPLTSIALGAGFFALYLLMGLAANLSELSSLMFVMGSVNIILGLFNMIPAFPMDGGRVLRAYLAQHMPYVNATQKAAYVGKMLAILMAIIGLIPPALNPWLVMIAFFIYIGASEEEQSTLVSITLEGIHVGDIMSTDVLSVNPNMGLKELADLMFTEKHLGYPVVDDGTLVGMITFTDVRNAPQEERGTLTVGDVMTRDLITISPEDEASKVLQLMSRNQIGRLIVTDNGNMMGIVSRTDLIRAIELLRAR